jgi:hypothetical protein
MRRTKSCCRYSTILTIYYTEELLQEVKCPRQLIDELDTVWVDGARGGGVKGPGGEGMAYSYEVVQEVVQDDEEDTLHHTLYRYY